MYDYSERGGGDAQTGIRAEHPEYRIGKALWRRYRHLYLGGEELKKHAAEYLVPRHKEPSEIYGERVRRVFYENYLGSIIDWYSATLFRREPLLMVEGGDRAGRQFFGEFIDDCDLRGTAVSDFFRARFVEAMIFGSSYIVLDFPRIDGRPQTRAEEEAMGAARAYLAGYTPEDVTNWSRDETGALEWVVIRTTSLRGEGWPNLSCQPETKWVFLDREKYRVYRSGGEGEAPVAVAEGYHGLAKQKQVPLFELRLSEGLWIANKAGLLQLEHFNKSNALSWALTMGLFAMPVIYSEKEWQQALGESYYLQLGQNDRFGWTEPTGNVYQIAADNLARLKDEIYRVCYLMSQSGSSATVFAQSGLSKQRDYAITQEVLRAYGDSVKDCIRRVIKGIELAREDGLKVNVSGLDEFDVGDFSAEIEDAGRLLQLGSASTTLRQQVLKKLALKYLCDVRQEIKDKIVKEIDEEGKV